MLFYDRKGNRYKAKGMEKEPKFLSITREMIKIEKIINEQIVSFYQKVDNKYIHFNFNGEWFKGPSKEFKQIDELFDADHLLNL